ncbi:MAG: class I SAM-dependent methyltransferase [Candidatus Falkowbacteria bacterium]|nr:MAG: class I SAM-dependent methyltransferase [Candidatus Falkowbacteria bacterium]
MYKAIFLTFFKNKKFRGALELEFDNCKYVFGAKQADDSNQGDIYSARIKVVNINFFKRVILFGDTGFGEAFLFGEFTTPDLKRVLLWFVQNKESLPGFRDKNILSILSVFTNLGLKFEHLRNKNTKTGSKNNIRAHYDVSNDFYRLWLDETMTYSSAIFNNCTSLKEGQENKYRRICEQIKLNESDRVLEIGCGWGGFAVFAAKNYGCHLTITTISEEQFIYVETLIKKENLVDKIKLIKSDYRDLDGNFDKIVSIEMMEALGYEYVPLFLSKCQKLIKQDGLMCLQCIIYPDEYFQRYLRNPNFIKKYIFPGGELLSLKQIKEKTSSLNLEILDIHYIGQDYARTLHKWRENFIAREKEIKQLGLDEYFYRKWLYYFVYCEVGFETDYINDVQILIKKNIWLST